MWSLLPDISPLKLRNEGGHYDGGGTGKDANHLETRHPVRLGGLIGI